MGTNYYLEVPEKEACAHCGRGEEKKVLHIGKSSAGWCFGMHVDPDIRINNIEDWRKQWPIGIIKNEYGEIVSIEAMEEVITQREARDVNKKFPAEYLDSNYAVTGPYGLLRHKIGPHCAGHGAGTWDYCTGDFS